MAWQQTPHLIVLFLASVASAGWALYGIVFLRRTKRDLHVLALIVLNLAVAEWSFVYALQVASPTLGTKLLAYKLLHIGGVTVPPAWFLFSLAYAGYDDLITPTAIGGLAFIPAALLLALPTNPASLALTDATLVTVDHLRLLETGNGPLYALYLAYAYVLLVAGGYVFVRTVLRQNRTFRRASALLLVGVAVPFLVNVLDVAGLFPPDSVGINYTPVSLALSAFVFSIAVFRYRVFDLKPIARKTMFDSMREGVVVLNESERIVDLNPAAKEILDLDGNIVSQPASDVIPQYEDFTRDEGDQTTLTGDGDDSRLFVEMRRSPLISGELLGWIVILHDVTTREEYVRKVEHQNDRLDAFASIVAHDLRNPLNVISGHGELARETGDDAHFDAIGNAVVRMDELLEGLLTLSRQGDTIGDLEPVLLDTVATEAWSLVETDKATLTVDTEMEIAADAGAIHQVFENLFRNAVDHGGSDVDVRVGESDDGTGFYVEDNGSGIPEEAYTEVFDHGYSTGGNGLGLGLNIVQKIIEAHDWTISITEGTDGGVRFEIRGVETAPNSAS